MYHDNCHCILSLLWGEPPLVLTLLSRLNAPQSPPTFLIHTACGWGLLALVFVNWTVSSMRLFSKRGHYCVKYAYFDDMMLLVHLKTVLIAQKHWHNSSHVIPFRSFICSCEVILCVTVSVSLHHASIAPCSAFLSTATHLHKLIKLFVCLS